MKPSKTSPAALAHKKVKKESVSTWKKKAWTQVSLFVRQRDADEDGMVRCCSCPNVRHWKQGDAGHFIDGRGNANLYDVRGIHFQCKPCNGSFKNQGIGNVKENYRLFMLERYGQAVIDELEAQNNTTKQFTVQELKQLVETYKPKL